jgi:endonuclease/exonuclease/phosphatase family metal-dependent hydrolase
MRLHIISLNIHFGKKVESIAKKIKQNQNLKGADVIMLQEIEEHIWEVKSRAKKLAELLDMQCTYVPARKLNRLKHEGTHGLAILSKYPLSDVEVIPLKYFRLPYRPRKRIAVAATVRVGAQTVRLFNVHLDVRLTKKQRAEQLRPVLAYIEAHGIDRAIIAGDFNTLSLLWSLGALPTFYQNQKKYLDKFLQSFGFDIALPEKAITFDRALLRLSLDQIYTKGLSIQEAGIEHKLNISDHKPVWATVVI